MTVGLIVIALHCCDTLLGGQTFLMFLLYVNLLLIELVLVHVEAFSRVF